MDGQPERGAQDPERAPENVRASFDMMSIAPNFDLLSEACTAEEMAKTMGMLVKLDRSLIKTPGSTGNKKGSPDAIRKEIDIMLTEVLAGGWQLLWEITSTLQT